MNVPKPIPDILDYMEHRDFCKYGVIACYACGRTFGARPKHCPYCGGTIYIHLCTCNHDAVVAQHNAQQAAIAEIVKARDACEDLYLVLQRRNDTCRLLNAINRLVSPATASTAKPGLSTDVAKAIAEVVGTLTWYKDFAGTTEIEYDMGKRAKAALDKLAEVSKCSE